MLGGVYGVAAEFMPKVTTGGGTAFGAVFFLAANKIAAPKLGLLPGTPSRDFRLNVEGLLSHVIYASTLESFRKIMTSGH